MVVAVDRWSLFTVTQFDSTLYAKIGPLIPKAQDLSSIRSKISPYKSVILSKPY